MIQISTFPAAPSTERVPSLAEQVADLRYSINLQLLNNRVPGLESSRTSRGVPVITHFRFVNVDVLLHVLVVVEGNNCYEHCIDV